MVFIDDTQNKISGYEFQMLRYALFQLSQQYKRAPDDIYTFIENALFDKQGYEIHITHGPHYDNNDPSGPYHFNIQLIGTQYKTPTLHVYVEPLLKCPNQKGIIILPNNTVRLEMSKCEWRWRINKINTPTATIH